MLRETRGAWRRVNLLLIGAVVGAAAGWGKTPVILSTDVGNEIDDQWAITYMMTSANFDVQGIISALGPSLPDPSAHATYKILVDVIERRLGMVTHPPLFEGSSLPLADRKTPRSNAGVDFIVSTAKNYSKDRRLVVLTIGAATDLASAIITDPTICDRITVVAMGFKSLAPDGGKEYNVENDPRAWQVILDSNAPVVIGAGDVCQSFLALTFDQAKNLLKDHGEIGRWLWDEYQVWYFRNVKPLRVDDFSRSWIIWDTIVMAYVQGMTAQKEVARLQLSDNLSLKNTEGRRTVTWITSVDSKRMWPDFLADIDAYQRTHTIESPSTF